MLIGSRDRFVKNYNRKGSTVISCYLKEKGITNELKTIQGRPHRLAKLWNYPINLNYLKFCTNKTKE